MNKSFARVAIRASVIRGEEPPDWAVMALGARESFDEAAKSAEDLAASLNALAEAMAVNGVEATTSAGYVTIKRKRRKRDHSEIIGGAPKPKLEPLPDLTLPIAAGALALDIDDETETP